MSDSPAWPQAQPTEADRLAHQIALTAAISDIECFCTCDETSTGRWYNLEASPCSQYPEDRAALTEDLRTAARYLELRGRLVVHPSNRALVRPILDEAGHV